MNVVFATPEDPMLAPEQYAPLSLEPRMPGFGAWVEGVDLCGELDRVTVVKLKEAMHRFGVLFFRGQNKLSTDQHLKVASLFGKPGTGNPNVEKTENELVEVLITDENKPPFANLWHSDITWGANPPIGTMIQIQDGPEIGGNTAWACTRKAYACLSDRMKTYIEDLVAVHHLDLLGRTDLYSLSEVEADEVYRRARMCPPVDQPVVLTHPVTGDKSIYVNETFTKYIKDIHKYESKAILEFLYSWIRMPEFNLQHHWQKNDVAMWDNFTMQHYALGDYLSHRVNQRVTFLAE